MSNTMRRIAARRARRQTVTNYCPVCGTVLDSRHDPETCAAAVALRKSMPDLIGMLQEFYGVWCLSQKLGLASTDELLAAGVTPEQAAWLRAFEPLWDRTQEAQDRLMTAMRAPDPEEAEEQLCTDVRCGLPADHEGLCQADEEDK